MSINIKKKKVLILSTVARQFYLFEKYNIPLLKELGYEVHCAANNKISDMKKIEKLNIKFHLISIERNPFSLKNLKAFLELNKLLKQEKFNLIHCHSPVGGVLGRLIGWKFKIKTIYTAHGFHFYKGAPIINWLVYYPIEKFLSKFTDILITINKEDYKRAKTFYAKNIEYVPGVGIDVKKIQSVKVDKEQKRKELGISMKDTVLLSVGELNNNKNHIIPIKALAEIKNKNIFYLIAGNGPLKNYLQKEIKKLRLENQVKLLGYRDDIYELDNISDIFIFPSKREGLGLASLEAMASGLPIVASEIHGIKDYTQNEVTGYCIKKINVKGFKEGIEKLIENKKLRLKIGKQNIKIAEKYDIENIKKIMRNIYQNKI